MTNREKAIVMAHTGICMLEGEKLGVFYQYLNELYGRPVYTHEWLTLDIKEKSKPDVLQLCKEEAPERRGQWIFNIDDKGWSWDKPYMCDQCGEWAEKESKFCPSCGARMDGGENG